MNDRNRKGFTLIEVCVVMAILMVLVALLGPVLASAKQKAQATDEISRMRQLALAAGLYEDQNQQVPLGTVQLYTAGLVPKEILTSPLDATSTGWANDLLYYLEGKSKVYDGMVTPYRRSFVGPWDYGMKMARFSKEIQPDPAAGWLVSFAGSHEYMAKVHMGVFPAGSYKRLLLSGAVVNRTHRYQGVEEGKAWDILFLFTDDAKLDDAKLGK